MKLTIDYQADALYLRLTEGEVAETRQVSPGVMLDYDAAGQVVGVEMLSLSRRATRVDLERVLVENLGGRASVAEDAASYGDEKPR